MPRPRLVDELDQHAAEIGAQVSAGVKNDVILEKLRKDHGIHIGKRSLQNWLARYQGGAYKRRTPVTDEILEVAVSKVITKKAFKNVGYRKGLHADKQRVANLLKKIAPEEVASRQKLPKTNTKRSARSTKDDEQPKEGQPSVAAEATTK